MESRVLFLWSLPDLMSKQDIAEAFQSFGKIINLITIPNKAQAFIEYQEIASAINAKNYYSKPNTSKWAIKADFSNKDHIEEKGQTLSKVLLINITDILFPVTNELLTAFLSKYGVVKKLLLYPKGKEIQALVEMENELHAADCKQQMDNTYMFTNCNKLTIYYSTFNELTLNQKISESYLIPTQNTVGLKDQSCPCVVIVSNLTKEVTTDMVATLFGVYGNVLYVKLCLSKELGFVEYEDSQQTQIAVKNLNAVPLYGKQISVNIASSFYKRKPLSYSQFEKDFSNSKEKRFKVTGSKNCSNIYPPSDILHISNICPEASESDILKILSIYGLVESIVKHKTDASMYYAKCKSLDDAVRILMCAHNGLLKGRHIKISFARIHF